MLYTVFLNNVAVAHGQYCGVLVVLSAENLEVQVNSVLREVSNMTH